MGSYPETYIDPIMVYLKKVKSINIAIEERYRLGWQKILK